jgi:hypothetical protein
MRAATRRAMIASVAIERIGIPRPNAGRLAVMSMGSHLSRLDHHGR